MSITCTIPDAALRRACNLADTGTSTAAIALALDIEGFSVPRQTNVHPAQLRYEHGGAFATDNANPGVWTPAAVEELLAAPVVANRAVTPLPAVRTHELTLT